MKPERLSEIKKGLKQLQTPELIEICLKLVKFKKDNKEFVNYLLFEASNPQQYVNSVKAFLQSGFDTLPSNTYLKMKQLRKTLRLLNKHIKYLGSTEAEAELLIWFCQSLVRYAGVKPSQKALYLLFTRHLTKANSIIIKMHPDLQLDYKEDYNSVIEMAVHSIRDFNPRDYRL